jgi:hypothetical protein
MASQEFFTDRMNGPVPRIHDNLPEPTSLGLYGLFKSKADSHWFASHFPEQCLDGKGIAGTNLGGLWRNVRALVPQLKEEKWGISPTQPDGAVFDLMEYAAVKVAKPIHGDHQAFWGTTSSLLTRPQAGRSFATRLTRSFGGEARCMS